MLRRRRTGEQEKAGTAGNEALPQAMPRQLSGYPERGGGGSWRGRGRGRPWCLTWCLMFSAPPEEGEGGVAGTTAIAIAAETEPFKHYGAEQGGTRGA
jgi:hypothetical protein